MKEKNVAQRFSLSYVSRSNGILLWPELNALAVRPFSQLGQLVLLPFPTVDSACARLLTWWPSLCLTTLLSKMRSMRITSRKCCATEVPLTEVKSWVCRNDISTLSKWDGAICQDPSTFLYCCSFVRTVETFQIINQPYLSQRPQDEHQTAGVRKT